MIRKEREKLIEMISSWEMIGVAIHGIFLVWNMLKDSVLRKSLVTSVSQEL
jgi:hypothetical protein